MVRSIVAVVVTYIVMTILVAVLFTGLLTGAGFDRLFEPGTWKATTLLNLGAPAITVVCGLLGGWMCAKIARKSKPVIVLAAIVLVLGLVMAAFELQKPEPTGPRPANMTTKEFMEKGRQPTWFALLNPVFGAAGVLLGGCCLGCCKKK